MRSVCLSFHILVQLIELFVSDGLVVVSSWKSAVYKTKDGVIGLDESCKCTMRFKRNVYFSQVLQLDMLPRSFMKHHGHEPHLLILHLHQQFISLPHHRPLQIERPFLHTFHLLPAQHNQIIFPISHIFQQLLELGLVLAYLRDVVAVESQNTHLYLTVRTVFLLPTYLPQQILSEIFRFR